MQLILCIMQRVTALILTAFIFSATSWAAQSHRSSQTITLSFAGEENEEAVLRCSSLHKQWFLRLAPDFDKSKHPVVVSLNINRGDDAAENVLYGGMNLHGIQPFDFAAKDLAKGIAQSTYGRHRTLKLPETHVTLSLDVQNVKLGGDATQPYITDLKVAVSVSANARASKCDLIRRLTRSR